MNPWHLPPPNFGASELPFTPIPALQYEYFQSLSLHCLGRKHSLVALVVRIALSNWSQGSPRRLVAFHLLSLSSLVTWLEKQSQFPVQNELAWLKEYGSERILPMAVVGQVVGQV